MTRLSFLSAALGTLLGLQILRAFLPLLVYVLRDRVGLEATALGGLGLGLFATAFVMPPLLARRPPRRAALETLLTLALVRAALQLWKGDPAVSLALAAAGVIAFLAWIVAATGASDGSARLPAAALAGAALDVSLHALAGTRDLVWGGVAADVAALSLAAAAAIAGIAAARLGPPLRDADPPGLLPPPARGWLAWGAFLYLDLELLGNVARLASRTGLDPGAAGAIAAAGLSAAAVLATLVPRRGFWGGAAVPLLAGAFLARALFRAAVPGPLAVPLLLVAQLCAAALLARALAPARGFPGPGGRAAAGGGGAVLLMALFFLHYAGYDLTLPVSRIGTLLIAGAAAVLAATARPADVAPGPRPRPVALAAGALVALAPLARSPLVDPPPATAPAPGAPVRVVTFNLHNGFDELGGWAVDRMLDELAALDPDVVALQEVSRGWVINGSADLLSLARERLDRHAVAGPSIDTDWGSAVLVRAPPASVRTVPLPPRDLPLLRAATEVVLAEPAGPVRRVIATHFHHRAEDPGIREEQARFLVTELPPSPGSVLLGDFNARPGSAAMRILSEAGWTDTGGPPEVAATRPTYPSRAPERRIDTVLVSDPESVRRAEVAPPWGSDHRAVIVELAR